MASIRNLLSERRHPILLTLPLLLLLLFFFILYSRGSNDRFPFSYYTPSSKDLDRDLVPSHPQNQPYRPPNPNPSESIGQEGSQNGEDGGGGDGGFEIQWRICRGGKGFSVVDYIPCLDNVRAIKELQSRKRMEHRERHCPKPSPRCLVPLPSGYKLPLPWPKSRDMIWYKNVPHPKLVDVKKNQNWVRISGDYFVFPGGGTQFKAGVASYIQFIEQTLPTIEWGRHTRVVLDVGCGVGSFGGYLLDRGVITMSFAPKDEHEAQIQFALERGIPAFLSVIGTQKLPFPDNVFDMIHCARCRVHWEGDGGKPLLELNRILRPGGFFVWSATPVYRKNEKDQNIWNYMVALTKSICWKTVVKSVDEAGIGVIIYQKPVSNSCYNDREGNNPPLCVPKDKSNNPWYTPLDGCLPQFPKVNLGQEHNWPISWPERLGQKPLNPTKKQNNRYIGDQFYDDSKHWETLVSGVYRHNLQVNWSSFRNVMDMNAGFGGFAAALIDQPLWVMNTVPVHEPDTLPAIYDRGLIGMYHDWCEAFNTYPRTYDLLHSSFLLGNLTKRCDLVEVVAEMDRILRPGGWVVVHDTLQMIRRIRPIIQSLRWETSVHEQQFLVGKKGFWRPSD